MTTVEQNFTPTPIKTQKGDQGILMYEREFLLCFEPLFNKRDETLYHALEKIILVEDPKTLKPIGSPATASSAPDGSRNGSPASVKKSQPILIPPKTTRDNAIPFRREWRLKPNLDEVENIQTSRKFLKDKKEKPRESDDHRLSQRQKQIDYGKNTVGYENFIKLITKEKRLKEHPRTPDKYQVCSKRAWDGQVRKWRRQLHAYDPEGELSDDDAEIIDQNEQQDLIDQLDELANATLEMNITPVLLTKKEVTVSKESISKEHHVKEHHHVKEVPKSAIITPYVSPIHHHPPPSAKVVSTNNSNNTSTTGLAATFTPSVKSMMAPKAKRNILSDITNRDIKA